MTGAFFEASWSSVPVIRPLEVSMVSPAGNPAAVKVSGFSVGIGESGRRIDRDAAGAVAEALFCQGTLSRRRHVDDGPGEALASRRTLVVGRGHRDLIGTGSGVAGYRAGDPSRGGIDREACRQVSWL